MSQSPNLAIHFELTKIDDRPVVRFSDGDFFVMSDTIANFLMHAEILAPGCDLPDRLVLIEDKEGNHETQK